MRRHVYYYTLLDGYDAAAAELQQPPDAWLPPPARPTERGWLVGLTPAGALSTSAVERLAEVSVGEVTAADTVTVPIEWRPASSDRPLPLLEADLELMHLAGDAAHLSLLGTYRPPLSVVGELDHRLVGHRLTEACVRRFILDIATRIGERAAPPDPA